MYRIYFINQFSFMGREFDSLESALKAGKETGFEFSVHIGDRIAASWSMFGGTRRY